MIEMWRRLLQCRVFGHAEPINEPTELYAVTASYQRCPRCGRKV